MNEKNFEKELIKAFDTQKEVAFQVPEGGTEILNDFLNANGFKKINSNGLHGKKNHKFRKYMYKGLENKEVYYSALSRTRVVIGENKRYNATTKVIAFCG